MASADVGKSTYQIEVLNNRGKVTEQHEINRGSQESAHRVARQVLSYFPAGTHLNLYREGTLVEKFTMTRDGWTYEVLNGDTVRAAQRNWVESHTARRTTKKASTGKARRTNHAA